MIVDVDGYLCGLKDAQIRGGLHILGEVPGGRDADRPGAGHHPAGPRDGSRRCGRASPPSSASTTTDPGHVRRLEAALPRRWSTAAAERGWTARRRRPADRRGGCATGWCPSCAGPATRSTTSSAVSTAATCRPGPAGALTRGGAHVLPTGRNFYSIDPKALPTELSLGRGREAGRRRARAPPGRGGHLPDDRRTGAVGHRHHAHPGRRRGRGPGAAGRAAGVGGGVPPGGRPRARSRWPSWAGPAST